MLPLPPGGVPPGPAAARLRPLLDREPVAAQDGPGDRAIEVLTLAFAPVKRAIPGVRLGPAGEAAFRRPPASRGEGAEGTAFVRPMRSRAELADSESVEELLEEGQAFEAGVISGVENAPDADKGGVRTRQVPEDDVPQEYLDED